MKQVNRDNGHQDDISVRSSKTVAEIPHLATNQDESSQKELQRQDQDSQGHVEFMDDQDFHQHLQDTSTESKTSDCHMKQNGHE